jgi:hypothetical protein
VRVVRRGDGSVVDVVLRDGRRLPRDLETLFCALAADIRRPALGEIDDGFVAFKSAGHLVPVMSVSLQRTVTRRALLRQIGALRRCLDRELPGGKALVQRSRWRGWRVALPRGAAAAAGPRDPREPVRFGC